MAASGRTPGVGLFAEFEIDERLGGEHSGHRAQPLQDLQQVVVVAADHLGEQVELPGGDHHVVDLVQFGEPVRDRFQVAVGT